MLRYTFALLCMMLCLFVPAVLSHHSPEHEGEGPQLLFNDETGELYPRPGDEKYFVQRDDGNWYYTDAYYDKFFTEVEDEAEEPDEPVEPPVEEMEEPPIEEEDDAPDIPTIQPPDRDRPVELVPLEDMEMEEEEEEICLDPMFVDAMLDRLHYFALELNEGWNFVHLPVEVYLVDFMFVEEILTYGDVVRVFGFDHIYSLDGEDWVMEDADSMKPLRATDGFIVNLETATTFELHGLPLEQYLHLRKGHNFVGLPHQYHTGATVGDLLNLWKSATSILVEYDGYFYYVDDAMDEGAEIPIVGGQAFGVITTRPINTFLGGGPWGD